MTPATPRPANPSFPPGPTGRWVPAWSVGLFAVLGLAIALRLGWLADFVYAGSDSYAYLGAAAELVENHRYANRPAPWQVPVQPPGTLTPLSYGRLPGYPLLLATLIQPPVREYKDFLPVFVRIKPLQVGLDLVICLLVFFATRFVGGFRAAWPAVLLAATSPFLMLFSASVLSETLATLCSTAALFCLLAVLHQQRWPRLLWALGGALMALGMLVRIDGILLVPCLLLPALWPRAVGANSRRAGLAMTAWALLALTVVFSPWPVRNLLRFGEPHPFGRPCDVRGREMPHTAFFSWFATWLEKESETPATLFCFFHDDCVSRVEQYPASAFDSLAERERISQLFRWRASEGLSARVDDGFRTLARERLRRHPARSLLILPLVRTYYLWTGAADQPLRSSPRKIPLLSANQSGLPWLSKLTAACGLVGLLLLWTRQRTRAAALLLTLALVTRTAFLALIGFVENRYLLELLPMVFLLCGLALSRPFQRPPLPETPAR